MRLVKTQYIDEEGEIVTIVDITDAPSLHQGWDPDNPPIDFDGFICETPEECDIRLEQEHEEVCAQDLEFYRTSRVDW